MKILIAVDMEGISGVVNWDQVTPGHFEYARFRQLMTEDVNAAVRGAFAGGADEVVVADGHDGGNNLLIEALDRRARLNAGNRSPFAMVQGIAGGVNGVIFVGYHARAGSQNAILDHTWSSSSVANVWLNGVLVGEYGLNAAVCGHFNAPVLMITGDQTACSQAVDLLGALETVVVKRATGRKSAECRSPQENQQNIEAAASRAVGRLVAGKAPQPYRLPAPIQVEIEFFSSEMADRVMLLPDVQRGDARRVAFAYANMPAAYTAFRAAVALARG
jgi:D-amino peptidase